MQIRKYVMWVVTILLLAVLLWKMHAAHFDWAGFWRACRDVKWPYIVAGTVLIYSNSIVRAVRWSFFLRPVMAPADRQPWWKLIGAQFIGFAGLAAFGRIGELIRPFLLSKRLRVSFSSQIAVVAVERIFDLGAFGLLFAGNLLFSPELNTLPYHERFHLFGWAIAGIMAVLIVFVVSIRVAGAALGRLARTLVGVASKKAGLLVESKILEFRTGLNVVGSLGDFVAIAALSLLMWTSIAVAYVLTLRAFPAPVNELSISHSLLLMGFSVVGGMVSLPGIGGGAQIATGLALNKLFAVPQELATSAGIILWLVTTMFIILPGLIFAQVEQVSLGQIARESEAERRDGRTVN